MSLIETVFVALKDAMKPCHYSNLTQFLKGVNQGNCHSQGWKGYKAFPFTLYVLESTAARRQAFVGEARRFIEAALS